MTSGPVHLQANAVRAAVSIGTCADALEAHLRHRAAEGATDAADPARTAVRLQAGELLLMPSRVTGTPTVKLVTVADDPDSAGGRVKGVHVVFDPATLAPVAVMEAAALTLLRTAAVSLVALRRLAAPSASRLLLLGAGGQAEVHLAAVAAEWPLERVAVAARRTASAGRFAQAARLAHPHLVVDAIEDVEEAVAGSDVVVCATTSREPLFAGPVSQGACVVAVGAHTASTRELPTSLVASAFVVVEDRATALRESGNVAIPIAEGAMTPAAIGADLVELVTSGIPPERRGRPRVFSSVGMAWEDAVVSAAVLAGAPGRAGPGRPDLS